MHPLRPSTNPPSLESIHVPMQTLQGHTSYVTALAVLQDSTLVSGSWDKTLKLWDKNGRCVQTLQGHTSYVHALTVLQDSTLVSGSKDKTIKLLDKNGHCVRTLEEHTDGITALAVLQDGTLVSGAGDKSIKLWDKNGRCVRTLQGHTNSVTALAVLPDGTLVSGSDDKTIKRWDKNGRCVQTLKGHGGWFTSGSVNALAVLPDGTLVSGARDNTIKLWDKQGRCVSTLQGHTESVYALAVLPDGTLVSGGGYPDNTIKLWEVQALRLGKSPEVHLAASASLRKPEEIKEPMAPAAIRPAPVVQPVPAVAAPAIAAPVPAPVVAPASPPARPVPPLVNRVGRLLKEAKALSLSKRECDELDEIEEYHQHFYNAPVTDEARHELNLQVARLNELIDRKTQAPAAFPASPSGSSGGGGPTEEKRPSTPKAAGMLDSQGRIRLNISIPYEKLRYQEVLGEGAFGVVYRGRWDGHTDVAIKELKHKQLSANSLEEFKLEATNMARLNHERVVRLYGVCLEPSHYGLVMEYLPNVSLYQLLNNGQPLPWSVRHQIVMDVTQGMTYLHANQMVHCDLKSLNVLLDDRLRAKIADFGLAKLKTETASTTKGAGGSRGSVPWMAPELFKRGGKNSKASDVYAYGMVLWEITSRKVPFSDAASVEIMMAWIQSGEKETIPDECPVELKSVMEDCWKSADQRPAMSAALARLERWQAPRDAAAIASLFASTRQRQGLNTQEAAVADQLDYASNQQSLGGP